MKYDGMVFPEGHNKSYAAVAFDFLKSMVPRSDGNIKVPSNFAEAQTCALELFLDEYRAMFSELTFPSKFDFQGYVNTVYQIYLQLRGYDISFPENGFVQSLFVETVSEVRSMISQLVR